MVLESIPFTTDLSVNTDVRYEPLIRKLVTHVRENIELVNSEKILNSRCSKSTIWMMKAFRKMIENRWGGKDIYQRDEDGGPEDDEASKPVVDAFNQCGVTALCLDLIASGIDEELQVESIRLMIAMLLREGGSTDVQRCANEHLRAENSFLFFSQVRSILKKLIEWHKLNNKIEVPDGGEVNLPEIIVVVRFLQLLCEGHFHPNQEIFREQPFNSQTVNLLDIFVNYVNHLSRIQSRTSTEAACRITDTIVEVLQGPCKGNQTHFTINTDILESMNRILRARVVGDCDADEEIDLKKNIVDIYLGLLEGQGRKSLVYERVLSVIHFDIIQTLCYPSPDEYGRLPRLSEQQLDLQTTCLVLLQSLCDYKPSLRTELDLPTEIPDNVGSVEIIWNGDLQRRFFNIPDICGDLAESSKTEMKEKLKRESAEIKLHDFLHWSNILYSEIKHQELLRSYKVSTIFSITNKDNATWFAFLLAIITNLLYLFSYTTLENGSPSIPVEVDIAINVINMLQIITSAFTLTLVIVVRVPIVYQNMKSNKKTEKYALFYSFTDFFVLYYFGYLAVAIVGYASEGFILCFLLLDILMKNPIAQQVCRAVYEPIKQIFFSCVLLVIVTVIFNFFLFYFSFGSEASDNAGLQNLFCQTMSGCFQMTIGYGLKSGGGIADYLSVTSEIRYVFDFLFFLVLNTILMNVVFGIIIDNFGEMRAKRDSRVKDQNTICMICGIDKQTFDRFSDAPNGFELHIKNDHNPWNYFYFIVFLMEQDKDDDDGMEYFVRKCIDAQDLSWFPMNKAMCLNQNESDEDRIKNEIEMEIGHLDEGLQKSMMIFQSDIRSIVEKMANVVISKTDPSKAKLRDTATAGLSSSISQMKSLNVVKDEESISSSQAMAVCKLARLRNVHIHLIRLCDILLSPEDIKTLSCRIVCEESMYSIEPVKAPPVFGLNAHRAIVHFETQKSYLVCRHVAPNDPRTFRIQILIGDIKGGARFLAILEIDLKELLNSDGLYLEKQFAYAEEHKPGVLVLKASTENHNH